MTIRHTITYTADMPDDPRTLREEQTTIWRKRCLTYRGALRVLRRAGYVVRSIVRVETAVQE